MLISTKVNVNFNSNKRDFKTSKEIFLPCNGFCDITVKMTNLWDDAKHPNILSVLSHENSLNSAGQSKFKIKDLSAEKI